MNSFIVLREWERRGPALEECLRKRILSGGEALDLAQKLSNRRQLIVRELAAGLEVESTSFVGSLVLDDLCIRIAPKLSSQSLIPLFRYAYGLRDLHRHSMASYGGNGELFQDLIVLQLYEEAQELMASGLEKRYRVRREDLPAPRGKLDMRRMPLLAGTSKVPCQYWPRLENTMLNQVLMAGLRFGAKESGDRSLAIALRRLSEAVSGRVDTIPLTHFSLEKAYQQLNRKNSVYEPALRLVDILLQGKRPSLEEESEDLELPGFLFDMNRFFQRLVGRLLDEHLPGYEVKKEAALHGMMRYAPNENPRGKMPPKPRPDFVVLSKQRPPLLVDAKYRDLWAKSLPREILYQLSMYALSQPYGAQALLLYPADSPLARRARIEIADPIQATPRASVVLQPIVLDELWALLAQPLSVDALNRYVQSLVFGAAD